MTLANSYGQDKRERDYQSNSLSNGQDYLSDNFKIKQKPSWKWITIQRISVYYSSNDITNQERASSPSHCTRQYPNQSEPTTPLSNLYTLTPKIQKLDFLILIVPLSLSVLQFLRRKIFLFFDLLYYNKRYIV